MDTNEIFNSLVFVVLITLYNELNLNSNGNKAEYSFNASDKKLI